MKKTISIADKPTLDEVKALLENSGYGLSALKSLLSAGSGAVKSVQSGVRNFSATSLNKSATITLSKINPNKSIVLLQGGATSYTNSNNNTINENNPWSYYGTLTETYLIITAILSMYSGVTINHTVNWQVIEFY